MDEATENMLDVILGVTQTVVVLVAAIWAYFRLFREGIHKPRIELDVECSFHGPQNDRYVAAFIIHATNRGNVEQIFPEIRLRVRGIESAADLNAWKGHEPLLEFANEEFDTVDIIPKSMEYYFVRPGVHQKFSYVTSVTASWRFVIARATFKYEATNEVHTVERAFEVRDTKDAKPVIPPDRHGRSRFS